MSTVLNKISVSLLGCDLLNIEKELDFVKSLNINRLHVDIMDGHYVENFGFPLSIVKLIKSKYKNYFKFDFHLMVDNPLFSTQKIFSDIDYENLIYHFDTVRNVSNKIGDKTKIKIAFRINDDFGDIIKFIKTKNFKKVVLMAADIGKSGQEMYCDVIDKIKMVKMQIPDVFLEIDGGINSKNIFKVLENGADLVVTGSFFFQNKHFFK
ncbi:hypothetical protein MHBO_001963 [Bonamia ostreae]|uniref:Ribulose-phosphate 3-epimerase n=1 Tax=Bonamia ostreae TaxID=126728 RepID=A0ABV2AKQ8_9EUKA